MTALQVSGVECAYLLIADMFEDHVALTVLTTHIEGIRVLVSLHVGQARIQCAKVTFLGFASDGLVSPGVQTFRLIRLRPSSRVQLVVPKHSARRARSVPSMGSHRRSIGGRIWFAR
jgi:hypothetical protein